MGGFFGTVSTQPCKADLFYGTDYQSHMGTKRGGMVTVSEEGEFFRSIHNLESTYFRTRFEDELEKFKGNAGIGVISDTDAQPMLMNSPLLRLPKSTIWRNSARNCSRKDNISANSLRAKSTLLSWLPY